MATASLFPRVSLSGGLGTQSGGVGLQGSHIWAFGPSVYWPLLDFGALDAQVSNAHLQAHEQLVGYKRTIVGAVRDADNSMANFSAQIQRLDALSQARVASERAVSLAGQRYDRGLTDFLNVVDAQHQQFTLEDEYTAARQSAADAFISLCQALGGRVGELSERAGDTAAGAGGDRGVSPARGGRGNGELRQRVRAGARHSWMSPHMRECVLCLMGALLARTFWLCPSAAIIETPSSPVSRRAMLNLDFHPSGHHFLQIPGPSPVPDRLLRAMSLPTIDHRGPEFGALGLKVLSGIGAIFKTKHPVVIYPASGTGAWEAALVNTLSSGDQVLMYETGHFASLWIKMARRLASCRKSWPSAERTKICRTRRAGVAVCSRT